MNRHVPQPLAVIICTLRRHPRTRYAAWMKGVQVIVYTCACGRSQDTKVLAANRRIRRGIR